MTIQPGEFWVAEIRFTDGLGSKKRPVLVLWLDGSDAVIAAVTSAAARSTTDVPLADWRADGSRCRPRELTDHVHRQQEVSRVVD